MTLRSVPTFPSKETVKKPLETHSGCGLRQRRRSKRSKVPAVESINGLPMGQGHWIEHDDVSYWLQILHIYILLYIVYIVCLSNGFQGFFSNLVIYQYMYPW